MTHARRTAVGVTVVWLLIGVGRAPAQTPEPQPEQDLVQVDAFQCWRDIRSRSVRVGEPFEMTVTCSVVETETATTVRGRPRPGDDRPCSV